MSEITEYIEKSYKNLSTRDHGNPAVAETLLIMNKALRQLAAKVEALEKEPTLRPGGVNVKLRHGEVIKGQDEKMPTAGAGQLPPETKDLLKFDDWWLDFSKETRCHISIKPTIRSAFLGGANSRDPIVPKGFVPPGPSIADLTKPDPLVTWSDTESGIAFDDWWHGIAYKSTDPKVMAIAAWNAAQQQPKRQERWPDVMGAGLGPFCDHCGVSLKVALDAQISRDAQPAPPERQEQGFDVWWAKFSPKYQANMNEPDIARAAFLAGVQEERRSDLANLAELTRLRNATQWRDASKEKPEAEGDYLVEWEYSVLFMAGKTIGVMRYDGKGWDCDRKVLYWMPIPPLPKEEK